MNFLALDAFGISAFWQHHKHHMATPSTQKYPKVFFLPDTKQGAARGSLVGAEIRNTIGKKLRSRPSPAVVFAAQVDPILGDSQTSLLTLICFFSLSSDSNQINLKYFKSKIRNIQDKFS